MTLLYKCLIGSRLYGTERPDSDYDWLEVHQYCRNREKVVGDNDTRKFNLTSFLALAGKGSHQVLEAMFAPDDVIEVDQFRQMRLSYRCDTIKTALLYKRTIRSFLDVDHSHHRALKSMRSALRMSYNLEEILSTGEFNPRMSKFKRDFVQSLDISATIEVTNARMSYLGDRFKL